MSKLAITRLESNVESSSEKENGFLIMYSLDVKGASKSTKNLAIWYVGVPISDKIGGKRGTLSLIGLCILARPYKIPGLEPTECKSFYFSSKIWFFSLSFCKTKLILFSILTIWLSTLFWSMFWLNTLFLVNIVYEFHSIFDGVL